MLGKKPSELNVQDLHKFKKTMIGLLIGLIVAWIFIIGILYAQDKEYFVFSAVAISTLLPIVISIMNIQREIVKRNQH